MTEFASHTPPRIAESDADRADRYERELERLRIQLARTQYERDVVLQSTIWRVTRPLRALAHAMPPSALRLASRSLRFLTRGTQTVGAAWREPGAQHRVTDRAYADWIRACDTLSDSDRADIAAHIARLADPPLISIVLLGGERDAAKLRATIASVHAQLYPHWELLAADTAAADAANALASASGRFVAVIEAHAILAEQALYEIAVELAANPDADLVYADEDRIDRTGRRHAPHFKPAWNIDLMLGQDLIGPFGIYRRTLIEALGGLREAFAGAEGYDLALRVAAASAPSRIRHIPAVLVHRPQPDDPQAASDRDAAERRAVAAFLQARGHPARARLLADAAPPGRRRVEWLVPEPAPRVTMIVPTRDRAELLRRCTGGLLERTDYPDFELIVVDNDSSEPATIKLLKRLARDRRVRVLPFAGAFNYSAINNAAASIATGEVLVLVNNDIDVIGKDWLREMVGHAMRPDIGAVGARLLYADGTIQHAGVALGVGSFEDSFGVAGHLGLGLDPRDPGYFGHTATTRELSAVTGACLAIRKSVFDALGGLDAEGLTVAFNDVDLCLRIRASGMRVVWTPFAELYHLESASRGRDVEPGKAERFRREIQTMRNRWGPLLDADPFYNANFSRIDATLQLAIPGRRKKPWLRTG